MIETEVLIIGSGPAGSTAALALSTYGIANVLVTKHRWLANTPRAHVTNQRTFEVLRDLGVEEEAKLHSVTQKKIENIVFCHSLAGEELGRIHNFGNHPARRGDYTMASPCEIADVPQNLLEPVLLGNAAARGTRARFDTEYLSLAQDEDGVTATVQDRLSGEVYKIRAKYLIGADGGKSKVAEDIGLPMEGSMALAGSMNIVFDADLTQYVEHRPGLLYMILQPGLDKGGVGIGVIRMVRPWKEWMLIKGHDLSQGTTRLTDEEAIKIVHDLVGDRSIPVHIRSTSLWTVNNLYATHYSSGRVFCMGDAVHRHPPNNGLGSNTSIQDAYNLAWKLALVLQSRASSSLLESYDQERVPVGRQIVLRANKSIESYGPIFQALGIVASNDPAQANNSMESLKAATPKAAEQREQLRMAVAGKNYEFNTHGVEMNQHYASSAVISEETEPLFERDPELFYYRTTLPGARLPHIWLQRAGRPVSTLDIVGKGRFSIITGIGGEAWTNAAAEAARQFGVPVEAYVVGPGRDLTDLYGEWADAREIDETGCLLVRPDGHVAWRAHTVPDSNETAQVQLCNALGRVLGRSLKDSESQNTDLQLTGATAH
jgi:2,4-dichlorophenol 6-monooxygenase